MKGHAALRSTWAIVFIAVAPGLLACGASHTPTKAEIVAMPSQSMHDCTFAATGAIYGQPFTANGELVLKPSAAASWTIAMTDFFGNPKTLDFIRVGQKEFLRMSQTDLWEGGPISRDDPSDSAFGDPVPVIHAFQGVNPVAFVGEEKISGEAVWHIRTHDSTATYDEWVRKSDGALSRLTATYASPASPVTISCIAWNTGATVKAPAPLAQACASLDKGDVEDFGILSAGRPRTWAAETGFGPGVDFTCGGGGGNYLAALAIIPTSGSKTVETTVTSLRLQAAGEKVGDVAPWNVASYQGESFDITLTSIFGFSSPAFTCLRPNGGGCEAGLKMRVGAIEANGSVYVIYFFSDTDTFDAFFASANSILSSVTFKH